MKNEQTILSSIIKINTFFLDMIFQNDICLLKSPFYPNSTPQRKGYDNIYTQIIQK